MLNFTMHTATDEHLKLLQDLVIQTKNIERGGVLELGCFEGRSSIAICEVSFPDALHCVDTWEGGLDGFGNSPVAYINFIHNMEEADCAYIEHRMDMFEYLEFAKEQDYKYKFIYLDASHDFKSVLEGIKNCVPLLVKDGILCGDDFLNANKDREDLQGGVQLAVESFFGIGNFNVKDQMWWIVKE